jgi:hypothetical protein
MYFNKYLIILISVLLSLDVFSQIDAPSVDKNIVLDTIGNILKFKTNFVGIKGYHNKELVEIDGQFVDTYFQLDTNFTFIDVNENNIKLKYLINLDSTARYDFSYIENDTNFIMTEIVYYFSTNNNTQIELSIYNKKYPYYIKIINEYYNLTYSGIEDKNRGDVILNINHNKMVMEYKLKNEKIKGD